MKNTLVKINEITIKNDFGTDPKQVTKVEIDNELDDIIPSATIECKNTIYDLVNLTQNQVVEIFDTETNRIFYGYITEVKNEGATVQIEASMETIDLLRKRVNKIYTSTEDHEGKNELIVKDLIELAGLTADVETPSESNIINEFKCIQAVIYERILALQKALDYQIRYDPNDRIVHYEPRGFIDNSETITTKIEIVGLPEWNETTDGMINNLRVDGATTETDITETGTIGTDENWETTGITLTKTPNIVELIIDGDQKTGGTKDASVDHYFWVDRENKKIMPKEGTTFPEEVAIVNYSWSAPAPVQDFNQESIENYGEFQEVFTFNDITSVRDAEKRVEKILQVRSTPFLMGKIKVRNTELQVGEIITVVDNVSTPNKTEELVVNRIKNKYPSGYLEVEVGDKELKLEDDIVEMENRVKRLEEQFIRNQDLLLQLVRLNDTQTLPRERYLKVLKADYIEESKLAVWDNPDLSEWDSEDFAWGGDEEAFEQIENYVTNYGEYVENFTDEDFKDEESTTW